MGKYNRGLLKLMRRHHWNLSPEQQNSLEQYLATIPGLAPLYWFKQDLCLLLSYKHQTAIECKRHIPRFLQAIAMLKESGFAAMKALGETLDSWKEEIARMWRFTKTNSITEGLHNKMELICRRAYGFSNFNNYRLRVRLHCGYPL